MMPQRIAGRLPAWIVILVMVLQTATPAASDDSLPAGNATLTFDPAKTTIVYTLIGWPHSTHGTFKLKRGTIRIDPVSGKMDGLILVDAASGESGNSMRDARMKDSILEVGRYPDISFAPRQVESHGVPRGEFPVVVRGIMTLRGGQHPFTIASTVQRRGDVVTIRGNFAVPYVAWGLENPSVLFFTVAKDVELQVTAVAHLSWGTRTHGDLRPLSTTRRNRSMPKLFSASRAPSASTSRPTLVACELVRRFVPAITFAARPPRRSEHDVYWQPPPDAL